MEMEICILENSQWIREGSGGLAWAMASGERPAPNFSGQEPISLIRAGAVTAFLSLAPWVGVHGGCHIAL
jgi:hypothetical protein